MKNIKKNYLYNVLYEILAVISPLITAPYVSRIFGADGIGIYSYTNAIATYCTMFAALGVKSYGQHEIARHRNDIKASSKLFWELEPMCISTTAICLLFWFLLTLFSRSYSVYYAVLSMTVLAVAFDISWFWAGHEEFKFIVIRNSVVKIVGIILLFTFVKKKDDLLLYIALISASGLLGNISMWSNLHRYLIKVNIRELNIKRHYKQTFIYFIPTVATSIYTILDKAMIGWITKNDFQNGYYEQATKMMGICKTFVFSINNVVFSRMSFLFAQDNKQEILSKFNMTVNFVMLMSIPIMFGLIGISDIFVPMFFGKGYEEVVYIVYIISPLLVIIGISNCLGSLYFTPSGQRGRSNKGIVTGAAVNVIFNLILIPIFAARGAAIASVMAESVITLMYIYMSRDYMGIGYIFKYSIKRLIAAAIMLICISAIHIGLSDYMLLLLKIFIGAVIYVIVLLIMKDDFLLYAARTYIPKIRLKR